MCKKYTLCQAFPPPLSLLKMKKKKDLSQIYTDLLNLSGIFNLEQVYMIVLATYSINR